MWHCVLISTLNYSVVGRHVLPCIHNASTLVTLQICMMRAKSEQLVKVIWQQAASPPHVDGSVVFMRRRRCALRLIHAFLAHPSPQPKRHLDRFSHFCTADGRASLYFTVWAAAIPPQCCPFPWEYLDSIQYVVPWAHPFSQPKRHLHRLTTVTYRQTNRPRYSVGNKRPHLCTRNTTMRPEKKLHHITVEQVAVHTITLTHTHLITTNPSAHCQIVSHIKCTMSITWKVE